MKVEAHPASFRDPSGFLFHREGTLFRFVAPRAAADYDLLMSSGLYGELVQAGLLVAHEEVDLEGCAGAHRVLRPERVPLVSYPYEWAFSQLQDAALLTLDVAERALRRGLSLKDASAFNVQFLGCRPVFIDTLSFEATVAGRPWVAYRQFCEHFLAPLALMAARDPRLSGLWRAQLEGCPLDLASRLLPRRTWLRFGLLVHLHLHARSQARYAGRAAPRRELSVSPTARLALLDSLRAAVRALRLRPAPSEWGGYEATHGYTAEAREAKEALVARWLNERPASQVWDLGGNLGRFARLAVAAGAYAACLDGDPFVVEAAYRAGRAEGQARLLPLLLDVANPSPGLGWSGEERAALESRGPADVVLALALVHHLAIGRNVPLERVADGLSRLGRDLIVEFVPKDDPQVGRLLRSRRDVFPDYAAPAFEAAFARHRRLAAREALPGSGRLLYLWRAAD